MVGSSRLVLGEALLSTNRALETLLLKLWNLAVLEHWSSSRRVVLIGSVLHAVSVNEVVVGKRSCRHVFPPAGPLLRGGGGERRRSGLRAASEMILVAGSTC